MDWYAVRIILESVHEPRDSEPSLFEDRIVVVQAADGEHASEKVAELVKQTDRPYRNVHGQMVHWRFKEIIDIKCLFEESLGDGAEVYYAHLTAKEVDMIKATLRPLESPSEGC